MTGLVGIAVALAMYWLTGVVGAASLPPDDQYSPQHSLYRTDGSQEPRDYSTWLKYQQDLTPRLEPPDFLGEWIAQKDSFIRDLKILPLAPRGWSAPGTPNATRIPGRSASLNLVVPKNSKIASSEDDFMEEENFQDQGPGSIEVYKLDLRRENSLLLPQGNQRRPVGETRIKSKIPKKVIANEILWKLKSMEANKDPLPLLFQQPPRFHGEHAVARKSNPKVVESRKEALFGMGGVPELQVGCEGLASERQKRSNNPSDEKLYDDYWYNSEKYKDPVYRESTEPILLRVTPIVLDLDQEEPHSGEIYEELDELLKLKKMAATSPKPTTKRWNRADIDPALEMDKHQNKRTKIDTFPERGDLGPYGNGSSSGSEVSNDTESSIESSLIKEWLKASTDISSEPLLATNRKDKEDPSSSLRQTMTRPRNRKLLWTQNPISRLDESGEVKSRHRRALNARNEDRDLWGFGEDDGASDSEEENEMDKLGHIEVEKRLQEYERRRKEKMDRRRGGGEKGHRTRPADHAAKNDNVDAEIEKIRADYERQLEKEKRDRERIMDERRRQEEQRRREDIRRRQEKEPRRRIEMEQIRNSDPSYARRQEEEQRRMDLIKARALEERRRVLENQRNHETQPSPLTVTESPHHRARNQHVSDEEERKLQEYIARNRPVDLRRPGHNRNTDQTSRNNNTHDERRRTMEEHRRRMEHERRREMMEEHRRRQQQPNDEERRSQIQEDRRKQQRPNIEGRRAQIEEDRRRQQQHLSEAERRRQMEEHRRRQQQSDDEGRHSQMEEDRGRQHQPNVEERRAQIEEDHRRQQQHLSEAERRRQLEEYRRRQQQPNDDERRQMEEHRRRQAQNEDERRRQMEEQRRRQQQSIEGERRTSQENRRHQTEDGRKGGSSTIDDERRRRVDEERRLQEYVRRNQPGNVPRRNNSEASNSSHQSDSDESRRTIDAAKQWEHNRVPAGRRSEGRIHGPSSSTNVGQHHSREDLEEIRRRQERYEEERRRIQNQRMIEEEERRREEEYRRAESRRREDERKRLEAAVRRDEENLRTESEGRRNFEPGVSYQHPIPTQRKHDTAGDVQDRRAEELRRVAASERTSGIAVRNREDERRRRLEEHLRQQHEERKRQELENERNSRNDERRPLQHLGNRPTPRQRDENIENISVEKEWRRLEHTRLSSLPVSARIIIRSDDASRHHAGRLSGQTSPAESESPIPSFGSRGNFDNGVNFPDLNPNRPGLKAPRFPAPATQRPPAKSPGACVWAIVQCCPTSNRRTACFESMGCPGINWDPNPCRGSLADAARAEVVNFYDAADEGRNVW